VAIPPTHGADPREELLDEVCAIDN
jgi:hypothetical protein